MDQTYLEQLTTLMDEMQINRDKLGHVELGYLLILEDITILIQKRVVVFDLTVQQIHKLVIKIIAEEN